MMKKKLILSFFFVALGFGVVKAQDLPDKKETLKTVIKVNIWKGQSIITS